MISLLPLVYSLINFFQQAGIATWRFPRVNGWVLTEVLSLLGVNGLEEIPDV
jgi:hypothetical protein